MLKRLKKHKYKILAVVLFIACFVSVFSVSVFGASSTVLGFSCSPNGFSALQRSAYDTSTEFVNPYTNQTGYVTMTSLSDSEFSYRYSYKFSGGGEEYQTKWIACNFNSPSVTVSPDNYYTMSIKYTYQSGFSANTLNCYFVDSSRGNALISCGSFDIKNYVDRTITLAFQNSGSSDYYFDGLVLEFVRTSWSTYKALTFDLKFLSYSVSGQPSNSSGIIGSVNDQTTVIKNESDLINDKLDLLINDSSAKGVSTPSEVGGLEQAEKNALNSVNGSLSKFGYDSPSSAVAGLNEYAESSMNDTHIVGAMRFVGWCVENLVDSTWFTDFFNIVIPLGLTATLLGIATTVGKTVKNKRSKGDKK